MRIGRPIAFLLLLAASSTADGDTIRLKNGSRFEGVVIRRSADSIEMKTMLSGSMTFPLADVETLEIVSPEANLLMVQKWERERKDTAPASAHRSEPKRPSHVRKPQRSPRSPVGKRAVVETDRLIREGAAGRSETANRLLGNPGTKWGHRESKHFIVFYDDAAAGKAIAAPAEYYLEKIAHDLNIKIPDIRLKNRFRVFVLTSKTAWSKLIGDRSNLEFSTAFFMAEHMEVYIFYEDRKYEVAIFAHELGHLALWLFCEKRPLPLWLHEGFAMYESGEFQYGQDDLVKAARAGKLWPLQELHVLKKYPPSKHPRILFYRQSAKLVEYLITQQGRERFSRFCQALADGLPLEAALRRSLKGKAATVGGLENAWLRYLLD